MRPRSWLARAAVLVLLLLPAACAGGGDATANWTDAAPGAATGGAPSFSIGGTMRGLYGKSW